MKFGVNKKFRDIIREPLKQNRKAILCEFKQNATTFFGKSDSNLETIMQFGKQFKNYI